jgi:hypothetical protein
VMLIVAVLVAMLVVVLSHTILREGSIGMKGPAKA